MLLSVMSSVRRFTFLLRRLAVLSLSESVVAGGELAICLIAANNIDDPANSFS
jgi:hypothetical protein